MPPPDAPAPAGQRFLYWLAVAATEIRVQAGWSYEDVASLLQIGKEKVTRFEKAKHWPRDIDRTMAGYAHIGGLEDPRAIYQRALDLWHEHGSKPLLSAKNDLSSQGGAGGLPELRAQPDRLPPLRPTRTPPRAPGTEPATDGPIRDPRRRRA
jgi:hypothetical protein